MKLNSIKFGVVPALAFAMTACTSDIDVSIPQSNTDSNEIGYNVVTNNMTRASASYCNNVQPERFKVVAYDGTSNYFGTNEEGIAVVDEIVKQEDGNWSHKDAVKRYWPDGKPDSWEGLTFYAYLSSSEQSATADENEGCGFTLPEVGSDGTIGTPKFEDFEVKSSVADQHDLMYAVVKGAKKKSDKNGSVTLNFRHALSQICFTAQNANPTLKDITIKSITVGGVYGKGTYTFPEETSMNNQSSHPNYSSIDETEGNDWEFAADAELTSYTVDFTTAAEEGATATSGISLGAVPENEENGAIVNLTKPVYTNEEETEEVTDHKKAGIFEKAMNLLPQKQEAAANDGATSGAYFKVTALLTNVDAAEDEDPVERTVFIPVAINWKENIRYTYNLKWTPTEIIYEPSFADYNEIEQEDALVIEKPQYKKVLMRASSGEEGSDSYVSALYFADRNIGAQNELDPGLYFAWGSVDGKYLIRGKLYNYDGSFLSYDLKYFYTTYRVSNSTNTTYNKTLKELNQMGWIKDGDGWDVSKSIVENLQQENKFSVLSSDKDAATKLMGKEWRIPSREDIEWLSKREIQQDEDGKDMYENNSPVYKKDKNGDFIYVNCDWDKVIDPNGELIGYNVVSKDKSCMGNFIFLPITGRFTGGGLVNTNYGYCWTSTPTTDENKMSCYLNYFKGAAGAAHYSRFVGMPIRAVSDSE